MLRQIQSKGNNDIMTTNPAEASAFFEDPTYNFGPTKISAGGNAGAPANPAEAVAAYEEPGSYNLGTPKISTGVIVPVQAQTGIEGEDYIVLPKTSTEVEICLEFPYGGTTKKLSFALTVRNVTTDEHSVSLLVTSDMKISLPVTVPLKLKCGTTTYHVVYVGGYMKIGKSVCLLPFIRINNTDYGKERNGDGGQDAQ